MGELSDVMQMLNRQQPGVHHNVSGSQMNSEDSLQQKISWVGNMDRDTSGLCAGHRQQSYNNRAVGDMSMGADAVPSPNKRGHDGGQIPPPPPPGKLIMVVDLNSTPNSVITQAALPSPGAVSNRHPRAGAPVLIPATPGMPPTELGDQQASCLPPIGLRPHGQKVLCEAGGDAGAIAPRFATPGPLQPFDEGFSLIPPSPGDLGTGVAMSRMGVTGGTPMRKDSHFVTNLGNRRMRQLGQQIGAQAPMLLTKDIAQGMQVNSVDTRPGLIVPSAANPRPWQLPKDALPTIQENDQDLIPVLPQLGSPGLLEVREDGARVIRSETTEPTVTFGAGTLVELERYHRPPSAGMHAVVDGIYPILGQEEPSPGGMVGRMDAGFGPGSTNNGVGFDRRGCSPGPVQLSGGQYSGLGANVHFGPRM